MGHVLVTGGTGSLGREVVSQLLTQQQTVRVVSRKSQPDLSDSVEVVYGDLASGSGLREAVNNVDTIIHCASDSSKAETTDLAGTRLLVRAIQDAGNTPHLIYVSIVGVDKAVAGYYRAKWEAENIVQQSRVPWTILRTTQFHDFVLQMIQSLGADTLRSLPVPSGVRFQSIERSDVAQRLVELVAEGPSGLLPDMGGPQVLSLEEMVQAYLSRRGRDALLRTVELPNSLLNTFRSDKHLCPEHAEGKTTWDEFLHYWYEEKDGFPQGHKEVAILMKEIVQLPWAPEVTVHTVELAPGAQGAPPHRHPGPIFGYVIEGEVLFEMHGHAPKIYKQGEVFYEPFHCVHLLANNPNPRRRALFVAVLLGEPGKPILTPVQLDPQAVTNETMD